MKGFRTQKDAGKAAEKLGLVGLTGSGQQCGGIPLPYGGWAYETAHNVWGGEPRPRYVLLNDDKSPTVIDEEEFNRLIDGENL